MTAIGDIILDPATVERFAWTMLHSFWQGAAVCSLLAVALVATARRSAQVRYVTLCTGLGVLLAAPVVTFWYLRGAFDDPGPLVVSSDAVIAGSSGYAARVTAAVRPWTGWLLVVWLSGALAFAVRALVAWFVLQRLLLRQTLPLEEKWHRLIDVADRLRLPHVRFLESSFLDVPATAGWLKPVVLLPASALTGLPLAHLEALVAHELAHIRRRDYLVNLLQTGAEIVLFYNPAVWWISRRIRDERENCCDDIAAVVTGGGRAFAEALMALQEHRIAMPLAMGATGGGILWTRVARLVGAAPRPQVRVGAAASVLAIALLAAGAAQVFGSAVYVRPDRQLQDVKSLCDAVYEIMVIAPSGEGFLPTLDAAVAEMRAGAVDGKTLDELSARLNCSRPAELRDATLPRIRVDSRFAHQQHRTWTHGTVVERTELADALWSRARRVSPTMPDEAARLARASLLLSAQNSFMFGALQMQTLLDNADFGSVSKLTPRQLSRLRRHVKDHCTIGKFCSRDILEAQRLVDTMGESGGDRAVRLQEVKQLLSNALRVGAGRYDIQWHVATVAYRLRHKVNATVELGSAAPTDGHFARWMNDTNETRPTTRPTTIRRMKREQFRTTP